MFALRRKRLNFIDNVESFRELILKCPMRRNRPNPIDFLPYILCLPAAACDVPYGCIRHIDGTPYYDEIQGSFIRALYARDVDEEIEVRYLRKANLIAYILRVRFDVVSGLSV